MDVPIDITVIPMTFTKDDNPPIKYYIDINKEGIPPDNVDDILLLKYNIMYQTRDILIQRIASRELWFIYTCITVIYILFVASAISGITSVWYENLSKSEVNPYAIGVIWGLSVILSYISIFIIWSNIIVRNPRSDRTNDPSKIELLSCWEHIDTENIDIDIKISVYIFIGVLLLLLWSTVFFQRNNIGLSIWIIAIVFMYHFWLLIYIWHINARAAIFLIPIIIIYGYLFYAMVHLASINNIGL